MTRRGIGKSALFGADVCADSVLPGVGPMKSSVEVVPPLAEYHDASGMDPYKVCVDSTAGPVGRKKWLSFVFELLCFFPAKSRDPLSHRDVTLARHRQSESLKQRPHPTSLLTFLFSLVAILLVLLGLFCCGLVMCRSSRFNW